MKTRTIEAVPVDSLMRIACDAKVPVLTQSDVLVVEATLAGCVTAWELASLGHSTVLVTSGTSVAHELIVVRQSWTNEKQWRGLPEPFVQALHRSRELNRADGNADGCADGEVLLNLARLAIELEDLLLDAGVRLYYGFSPCGVQKTQDVLQGVIFSTKAGLQAVMAKRIIDATIGATVARLGNVEQSSRLKKHEKLTVHVAAKVKQSARPGRLAITRGQISDDRLDEIDATILAAPGVEELVGQRVVLHGPYAQITLTLPVDVSDPLWLTRLSIATRQAMVRIGSAVQRERTTSGKHAVYFHRFSGGLMIDPVVRVKAASRSKPFLAAGLMNLWVCGSAADVSNAVAKKLACPFEAAAACGALIGDVAATAVSQGKSGKILAGQLETKVQKTAGKLHFSDAPDLRASQWLSLPASMVLPVLNRSDVLVVGGGTSGVPCALAAAKSQASITLVEHHADLGGTRTIGGVGSYWFGKPVPFQKACDDEYDKVLVQSGVAEEVGMMHCLLQAGVNVLSPCPVAGVVSQSDRVAGVVVVTADGLAVVSGKMVVDATGDADLAAWAGAPYEYGNGRDAMTLWGSFGNFNHQKRTCNRQYESSVEIRDVVDFSRNIVRGRRRPGMWRNLEHEMPQHYLTPRESRRILTDATVTYSGILASETFCDVMIVCESNFDIKGIASSDINSCGVVSSWDVYEKFEAAVPWRAVQPKGLSNLLVAGKAYGASHDAIALARMQRDMVSLGGAVGLAASQAVLLDKTPGELDVHDLQKQWLTLGVIRPQDQKHFGKPWKYTGADATRDCERLLAGRGRWTFLMARLMRSKASLPALRRAYRTVTHTLTKVRLARALCCLGDARGVAFLLESIVAQTRKTLPGTMKKHLAVPPEHGWAGEPVYSLRAIGLSPEGGKSAEVMTVIARKIEDNAERFGSRTDSQFEYVMAICAVAERHPSSKMLAPLNMLYRRHCLRQMSLPWGRDMRFTLDPLLERRAYLELCIGRAMARCGTAQGFEILARYSNDMRGTLARSATDELATLLGKPWPADLKQQSELIARQTKQARMQPFNKMID